MIAGVFHFAFTVSDIDRSVPWYADVLGLELVHRQRQDNEYTRRLVGLPGAVLEVAQFRVPSVEPRYSTHVLELVEYVRPGVEKLPLRNTIVGACHLALVVHDIHDRYDRLVEQGVVFRSPLVKITAGVNEGGFTCYFQDPDGITLELVQPAAARLAGLGLADDCPPPLPADKGQEDA